MNAAGRDRCWTVGIQEFNESGNNEGGKMTSEFDPAKVPLAKKTKKLLEYTEDGFRDSVVRPLFQLLGVDHGKDVCGVNEEGKDCYFWGEDQIRGRVLYAVQTKKGKLTMAAKASANIIDAISQLRTALQTPVYDAASKTKVFPDYVILAASGEINQAAQRHIAEEIKDPRLLFRSCDHLIPLIDKHIPELWYGIDARKVPYLRAFRDHVLALGDSINISPASVDGVRDSPIYDGSFVQLFLNRYKTKPRKVLGKIHRELELEQIPVDKLLQSRDRVFFLTGEAGSGKTTSLRRLGFLIANTSLELGESSQIPILINAVELVRNEKTVLQLCAEFTSSLSRDVDSAFDASDLSSGNVVLLVDGFDELGKHDQASRAASKLLDFHMQFKNCFVVVAARDSPVVSESLDDLGLVKYRISPIGFQQARKMIERLASGKSLSPDSSQEILRRLEGVHGLELSPLLVSVFVATTDYARSDIPANITELFKKYTELMLGRWDQQKGLAQQYQASVKDFLLCKLGIFMHESRVSELSVAECRGLFTRELVERGQETEVEQLLDEVLSRSGILRELNGLVSFSHHLLQEFYAGRGISDKELLRHAIKDHWWKRAVVFYFGENPDGQSVLTYANEGLADSVGTDRFQAAVTLGLAVQACYLAKLDAKISVMSSVVEAMADSIEPVLNFFGEPVGDFDVHRFMRYYIYGRDSVAAKLIHSVLENVLAEDSGEGKQKAKHDLKRFWCVCGLIDSGRITEAAEATKGFAPEDQRLLFGIFIGCFYVEKMHVTSDEQKKLAKKLRGTLESKIEHLQTAALDEFKSLILELRKDEITALSDPNHIDEDV